jgi:hypothetical protein
MCVNPQQRDFLKTFSISSGVKQDKKRRAVSKVIGVANATYERGKSAQQ